MQGRLRYGSYDSSELALGVNQALSTAIRSTEVRARLTAQGAEVVTMTPAETDKFFNAERARWRSVAQGASLQLD